MIIMKIFYVFMDVFSRLLEVEPGGAMVWGRAAVSYTYSNLLKYKEQPWKKLYFDLRDNTSPLEDAAFDVLSIRRLADHLI